MLLAMACHSEPYLRLMQYTTGSSGSLDVRVEHNPLLLHSSHLLCPQLLVMAVELQSLDL